MYVAKEIQPPPALIKVRRRVSRCPLCSSASGEGWGRFMGNWSMTKPAFYLPRPLPRQAPGTVSLPSPQLNSFLER